MSSDGKCLECNGTGILRGSYLGEKCQRCKGSGLKRWYFGLVSYTLAEIREIGRRHSQDGICYHPPGKWEPARGQLITEAESAYQEGYEQGKQEKQQ